MRILRILFLSALVSAAMLVPQDSSASSSVGYNRYYRGYHHYRPYYRPYFGYRPYYYRPYFGGFYPYYGLGFGFGYGYGPYGYGYGSPYSYYGGSFVGDIRTEVKPEEAQVFVDGDYAGVVDDFDSWWQRLEVSPGRHRIVFRSPGFQPYVVDLHVDPERDAHIKYSMVRGQDQIADLEMRLPEEEYRDDRYQRRDRRRDRYEEYRDRYERDRYENENRDRYEKENRDRYEENRDPYDDRDSYQRSDPYGAEDKPYFGDDDSQRSASGRQTLILSVEPSDATVYVDGNYYGTANDNGNGELQIVLAEGVHRVEVVRPGHDSFSQDVTVSKTGENRLSVTLRKK